MVSARLDSKGTRDGAGTARHKAQGAEPKSGRKRERPCGGLGQGIVHAIKGMRVEAGGANTMGCWGGGEGGGSAKPSAHVQRSGCGGYRGPAGPSRASGRAACSGPDARPWLCSWTPRLSPLPAGCAPTVLMLLDRCLQLVLPLPAVCAPCRLCSHRSFAPGPLDYRAPAPGPLLPPSLHSSLHSLPRLSSFRSWTP